MEQREITPPVTGSTRDPNESTQEESGQALSLWTECLSKIRPRVNTQCYKTWFEPITPLRLRGGVLLLRVPSQFFSEWLEEHYYSLISETISELTGRETTIDYMVEPEDRDESGLRQFSLFSDTHPPVAASVEQPGAPRTPSLRIQGGKDLHAPAATYLNPKYTFDNYITGESNQFARAAAHAVANNPGGTSFNPLVIYGGVGLGKTHLVHAIGNHTLHSGKTNRILYVSSEKFTVDFVEAIQKDSVADFSTHYRGVDVLLVDDIQFFAGKEKTQDVFFHTFNVLHQIGKQIVLSSDRPPKELKGLNERLISRFGWGLTADIQPPDLETRIAILRQKSSNENVELQNEVLEFIASNVTSNIRELEGCLISLLGRASLEGREPDIELSKEVVRSIVGEVRMHITIEEIQRVVCEHLGIPDDLIRAKTRKQEVVNARQIAMYLTKELTNSSLKTIGLHFGGRDHSTVIHAYQTVEDGMNTDPKQRQLVSLLRSKLERRIR